MKDNHHSFQRSYSSRHGLLSTTIPPIHDARPQRRHSDGFLDLAAAGSRRARDRDRRLTTTNAPASLRPQQTPTNSLPDLSFPSSVSQSMSAPANYRLLGAASGVTVTAARTTATGHERREKQSEHSKSCDQTVLSLLAEASAAGEGALLQADWWSSFASQETSDDAWRENWPWIATSQCEKPPAVDEHGCGPSSSSSSRLLGWRT